MKRWIGVVLFLLVLAGCAATGAQESQPELTMGPELLYPEAVAEEYALSREDYFSQEREAVNYTQWGYVIVDDDGSIHDCGEGPHLVWYASSESYSLKQYGVCLCALPEGEWTAVEDVAQVGVMVYTEQEMWLVTRDGKMEKLFDIPDVSLLRIAVAEPLYYVSFGQELYRGHLTDGHFEKILTVDEGRTIVEIRPQTSYRVTVVTAESENMYQNWDFSLEYRYNE